MKIIIPYLFMFGAIFLILLSTDFFFKSLGVVILALAIFVFEDMRKKIKEVRKK